MLGRASYIADRVKKRPDYSEMPKQAYLGEGTRLAVTGHLLAFGELNGTTGERPFRAVA